MCQFCPDETEERRAEIRRHNSRTRWKMLNSEPGDEPEYICEMCGFLPCKMTEGCEK